MHYSITESKGLASKVGQRTGDLPSFNELVRGRLMMAPVKNRLKRERKNPEIGVQKIEQVFRQDQGIRMDENNLAK